MSGLRLLLAAVWRHALRCSPRAAGRAQEGGRRTRPRPVESNPRGQAIEGPGYFVWDEDPQQARLWARELSGSLEGAPTRGGRYP